LTVSIFGAFLIFAASDDIGSSIQGPLRSRTIAHSVNLGLQGGIFLRQLIGTRFLFLVGCR
jgi:hypothetical protein